MRNFSPAKLPMLPQASAAANFFQWYNQNMYTKFLSKKILVTVFLILSFLVSTVACSSSNVSIRSVEISSGSSRPSGSEETSSSKESSKNERQDDADRTKSSRDATKAPTATIDYSAEYKPANLQNYAGSGAYVAYGSTENGPEVAALSKLVAAFLSERGVNPAAISIVYEDLGSSVRYSHNPDARYQAASVIKVAVAMVISQFMDEGILAPDAQIVYVPGEQFSYEDMNPARLGKLVPIQELVNSSVMYSDNAATSALFAYFQRSGRDLHFFLDERCGTHYAGDVSMSASEGLSLLKQLYFNGNYPSYQNVLSAMGASTWGQFLTGGIPVNVSSKYGQLGGLSHEIGIVWAERPFAYAVFSNGIAAYSVLPELGALLYGYHTGSVTGPSEDVVAPEVSGSDPSDLVSSPLPTSPFPLSSAP